MSKSFRKYSTLASGSTVAMLAALATAPAAYAQEQVTSFNIPEQPLATALLDLGRQAHISVAAPHEVVAGKTAKLVQGDLTTRDALIALLEGSGLSYDFVGPTAVRITAPQSGSAAGDGADGTVQALVVTAQKREENIQDVPIAMSAFTQEDLTRSQVAGGPDLMTQVPNFTFTKTNFSGYSIQIRGIGTQAISATTDAAVAVAFNNTPFIRNRFFEQEFYDLQRVEVLRGPQGTLYGRNATAGVVNIISAKPSFHYEAKLSGDVSNYSSTRLEGMINLPLVEDKVALRVAGAWTKRDGYATNQITGNPIDGRDLWSTRVSLRFTPTDNVNANLIWEHFQEEDDRLRSGKQLCKEDVVTHIGPYAVTKNTDWRNPGNDLTFSLPAATFSQGCAPSSLYSPDSFNTPNGWSLPYYLPLGAIFLPTALDDPYVSRTQSRNLRVIESTVDPQYRAKDDVVELQVSVDLANNLTLTSETGYNSDTIFSLEDYNRFNTAPGAWRQDTGTFAGREGVITPGPNGGIFCDPQIGCSDRLVAVDVSTAKSRQFSQEFRLSSNYDGAFNFSLGANFLRYDTEDKYYVFINSLSLIAALSPYGQVGRPLSPYVGGVTDNSECMPHGLVPPDPTVIQEVANCTYIDPNPIGSLNDQGHNYFLSKNPYKLISYAIFGEAYYNITPNLKLTAGLRWTVDRKQAPRIPSWVLASDSVGYPVTEVVNQEWREPTGRLTLDWKPDVSFTDETLLYASYAHGYKAGGANPPPTGPVAYCGACGTNADVSQAVVSITHPKTFDPEFVNAFEVGSKNTLLDGKLTLNGDVFYYDYTGYQISQIVDRSAVNLNFDATVWGLELEADWRPLENLRLGFKGGYEDTRVADGEKAVDLMDRTAGDPNWVVARPFPTFTSNCILPVSMFVGTDGLYKVGNIGGGGGGGCELAYVLNLDPVTEQPYDPNNTLPDPRRPNYHGFNPLTAPNHGEGISKDLSGNQLPNSPHFTTTLTADYTIPLTSGWLMDLHTDLYYQSEAWTRIFNMPGYDKLKAYTNVNLAAIFTNEDAGWKAMAYVKNIFDRDSITGAFLNSDDTGLTTNVFLTEPRLYGLRVTKEWTGEGWWTGANPNHAGPYPLTIEIGGQIQRRDAPYATFIPATERTFASVLGPLGLQNQDLDWGDGREVNITWRRTGSPWSVHGGIRFGRTNASNKANPQAPANKGCLIDTASCAYYANSPLASSIYFDGPNYVNGSNYNRDEYTLADFAVGRDVGLGGGVKSAVDLGLRYADLDSRTHLQFGGIPDWQIPDEFIFFKYMQHDRYLVNLQAEREFKGAGPVVAWDASKTFWGGEDRGHLDLDWSVTGGVLFGKQKAHFSGQQTVQYFNGPKYGGNHMKPVGDPTITDAPEDRSKSVSVPVIDLSLGLAYEVQRVKVGAGYRWERYFDAIDGGYDQRKSYDRTIDGPYFKIAVGFGG